MAKEMEIEILLKFCDLEYTQARHSESQRATVTNFILTLAIAGFAFIGQRQLAFETLMISIPLIFLGLYGIASTSKYYERWEFHLNRIRYWRQHIDELCPEAKLEQLRKDATYEHKKRKSWLSFIRLNQLWTLLHIIITFTAVGLTLAIILKHN